MIQCISGLIIEKNMLFNYDFFQKYPFKKMGPLTCDDVNSCPEASQTWPPSDMTSINGL